MRVNGANGTGGEYVLTSSTSFPSNNPPKAGDDLTTPVEDTAAEVDVLSNDSDPDGDGIYDTSALDTDFNGKLETFYTTLGSPDGSVYTRYDHDEDGLKDDEEPIYGTDPYYWDTDGDEWPDGDEVNLGTSPVDPWCMPLACG